MPKTSSDFTAEQRKALETADRRLSAREIADKAQSGELTRELEPFTVSASTVTRLRAEAEQRRQVAGKDRDDALDALDLGIVAAMDQALREIEADAAEKGKTDLTRLRQLAGARKNMREANYSPGKTKPERTDPTPSGTSDLLARLSAGSAGTTSEDESEEYAEVG